jgi:hypothetical protein
MNRKLEDAMVRLAFGDVTPEEVVALEREAASNPEAARALASYRRMRDGLRDLYDVPQDQLSKERLRHAILASGLKPQPTQSPRGWLWMPAAAAVLAFGFMLARPGARNGGVEIVGPAGGPVAIHAKEPTLFNPDLQPPASSGLDIVRPGTGAATAAKVTETNPTVAIRTAASTAPRRRKGSRSHREAPVFASISDTVAVIPNTADGDGFVPDRNAIVANHAGESSGLDAAAGTAASAPTAQPIVLIEGSKDNDTGAQKATEVDSSKNVRTSG